jgi:hypothetical protein
MLSLLLILPFILLSACEDDDGRESETNVDTNLVVTPDVPPGSSPTIPVDVDSAGRTELPTYNTGAGPLFISLPGGFSVRADRGLAYDMIFLYRTDDPVVNGATGIPPRAIARLQISDSIVTMDVPGTATDEHRLVVGGVPTTAQRYEETLPTGGLYISYTIPLPHFFATRDRTLNDLHLHIYVGGSDAGSVDRLLTSLSTLSFRP